MIGRAGIKRKIKLGKVFYGPYSWAEAREIYKKLVQGIASSSEATEMPKVGIKKIPHRHITAYEIWMTT